MRADATSYYADIINFCNKEEKAFAIGVNLDEAVVRAIRLLPEGDGRPYRGGYIAETLHCMNRTKKAFRLIVIRQPYQREGVEGIKLNYTAIASNRTVAADIVMDWHYQRNGCIENRVKEFCMERVPC